MSQELAELVEQLIEFGYGDSRRLEVIYTRLKNGETPYPSDQTYVDMLISKYLYPHNEEPNLMYIGTLERKIQNVKQRYAGDSESTIPKIPNLCFKCGSPVARMFSFCHKCGAFHDQHNLVDARNAQQKKRQHMKIQKH
jgi:hypothetical protein